MDILSEHRRAGVVILPSGRNRVVNPNFSVNPRAVSGTVTLGAYGYGHVMWKAGASGCTYTFATSGLDTTLTISAGTLHQVIEAENVAEGGTYTLSWTGTAQARIYQGAASGSYATSPITKTGLTAATNTTIEFSTGTLGLVQFEPGSRKSDFERRRAGAIEEECLRYYCNGGEMDAWGFIAGSTDPGRRVPVWFPKIMRAVPAVATGWTGGSSSTVTATRLGFVAGVNMGDSSTGSRLIAWNASAET